jgi:hypothetical protein
MIAGWLLIEIRSTTVYKQILNVFQSDFYFYNFNLRKDRLIFFINEHSSGIKKLANYVHNLGLKLGIYNDYGK